MPPVSPDQFGFDRFEKCLYDGVIIEIALVAHGGFEVMVAKTRWGPALFQDIFAKALIKL